MDIGKFFSDLFGPIITVFHYIFYLPVYNVLMIIYEGINKVFPAGAFALAIIILTLIIRGALIPLTRKQLQSTRKMQMIQPELKALQQRYRGDPQTLMAEQRRLYKEHGVSMYGGCLPLVVQLPFLYALYGAFLTVIQHQGNLTPINNDLYPFVPHLTSFPQTFFIWTDLVKPDQLHILPILAALLTFIQLRMAMPVRKPRQPGENPDPTMQATATTQYIMPVVTLFIGWTFPAGLALYWCISTGFSAVQQYFINGNWGSLFVGVPGMEHLVPPPKDVTPTSTRPPIVESRPAGRAAAATPPTSAAPAEGGLRGWWQRMKESAVAAQSQAMERAEQTRQELEAAREQQRQQQAEREQASDKGAQPSRRQRRARQGPVLVRPQQPEPAPEPEGDAIDQAIEQATETSVSPEQAITNGTTGTNGVKATSANGGSGTSTPKAPNTANGSTGGRTGTSGTSGTRSTTGGSQAARKQSGKGGSGAQSRGGGRSKKGR